MRRLTFLLVVVLLVASTFVIASSRVKPARSLEPAGPVPTDCGCRTACMGGKSCAIACPTGKAAHCDCLGGSEHHPQQAKCYCQ